MPPPGDQGVDDPGVQRGPAGAHLVEGPEQLGDVADPFLEQVGQAVGAVGQQRVGVGAVGVLGEHHDADVRGTAGGSRGRPRCPPSWPGGIRMSVITASGASRSTASSSSGALPTVAQTSTSPPSSSSARRPSRSR